jgi:hypothetical protein
VFVWIRVSESRRPLQQCNKSSHGIPVCCSSKSKTVNREATAVRQQQAKNPTNLAVGIFAMSKDLYSRVAQRSQTDSLKAHEISTCRRPSAPSCRTIQARRSSRLASAATDHYEQDFASDRIPLYWTTRIGRVRCKAARSAIFSRLNGAMRMHVGRPTTGMSCGRLVPIPFAASWTIRV